MVNISTKQMTTFERQYIYTHTHTYIHTIETTIGGVRKSIRWERSHSLKSTMIVEYHSAVKVYRRKKICQDELLVNPLLHKRVFYESGWILSQAIFFTTIWNNLRAKQDDFV